MLEPVLAPKEPPRGAQNQPKRAQEAPESTLKSIFKAKISIYQKCNFSVVKCSFCEGGRARVGAQNRRREAPRDGKRGGRRERKKKRKKCIRMARKGSTKKVFKLNGFKKKSIWKSIWIDDADPFIFTGRKWPSFTVIRFLRYFEGGR